MAHLPQSARGPTLPDQSLLLLLLRMKWRVQGLLAFACSSCADIFFPYSRVLLFCLAVAGTQSPTTTIRKWDYQAAESHM
mmetsp:Transcript_54235/g.118669  ORF Transcript_54235/g.118669 Transcript_54235/m.118669 type:complete len:80 (-) Transcript_54235:123-362(-)